MGEEVKSRYVGKNFYEVLGVAKNSALKDIQRAYRSLALKVHPDRNGNSPESTRDFQELSRMMEVLSDPERRAVYDATGQDDTTLSFDMSASSLSTFRKVTKADIDAFSDSYLGSLEEQEDVRFAYDLFQGDFEKMLEWIPLSSADRLPIYEKIISSSTDKETVWPQWQDRNEAANRFLAKYKPEEKEAEELLKNASAKYLPFLPTPNPPKSHKAPKSSSSKRKRLKMEEKSSLVLDTSTLVMGIREREKARHLAMVQSMEERFANESGPLAKKNKKKHTLPSEEEFARIQMRLTKRKE